MPRKRNKNKQQQVKAKVGPTRSKKSKEGQQGPLSHLIDLGAGAIKGIGKGMLPGLFKSAMVTAPNNVGVSAPRAFYKIGTGAQQIAEFDPDRSVRITGCGLFADGLSRNPSYSIYPFTPDAVNPFPAWRGVSPMSVDPRMMQLAVTYQFYAFRALRFTYIPETGTSGPVTQVNLALGISQDSQEFIDLPTPSLTQMLEQNQSILTPVWCTTTISYSHDGTRVWRTDPAGEGTIDSVVQCLIGGVLSNTSTVDTQGKLGELYVEYICDLYEPQPVEADGDFTVALPYTLDAGVYTGSGYQFLISNGEGYPPGWNSLIQAPGTWTPPVILPLAEEEKVAPVIPALSSNTRSGKVDKLRRLGAHLLPPSLGLPALGLPPRPADAHVFTPEEISQLRTLLGSPTQIPREVHKKYSVTFSADSGSESGGPESPNLV